MEHYFWYNLDESFYTCGLFDGLYAFLSIYFNLKSGFNSFIFKFRI